MHLRTVERETFIGPPKTITELCFQRCAWCATAVLRTSLLCPICASTDLKWVSSEGRGKVHGFVTIRRQGARPRTMAVVDLGDGIKLRASLEGAALDLASHGAPVSVLRIAPDGLPVFALDRPPREDR
ncbi:Zn-ribbon domain-containing OB-fold protein [Streptomyces sp. NPDC058052]|uniref:Zn-ribbon domain-containing OB-fold protein n=1 Tax=Streptomyces sp. NPDC058052 TaxID=3346316 RepID=UPI0036EEACB1